MILSIRLTSRRNTLYMSGIWREREREKSKSEVVLPFKCVLIDAIKN